MRLFLVRRGQATAVVSAGSTAAVVATARLRLRPLPGVERPALAAVLPTLPNPTVLIDAGATADPKPEMLVQFAHLGAAYLQAAHGVEQPRVGLLTIGSEPGKGNKLARRTYELLTAAANDRPSGGLPLMFAGIDAAWLSACSAGFSHIRKSSSSAARRVEPTTARSLAAPPARHTARSMWPAAAASPAKPSSRAGMPPRSPMSIFNLRLSSKNRRVAT